MDCQIALIVRKLIEIYIALMLVYAVASWLPGLRGRWLDYVAMAVEPVLTPVRRFIPAVGGFDLSFLIVILVMQFLAQGVVPRACYI